MLQLDFPTLALLPYLNNISSPMPAVSEAKTEVKKGG